MELTTSKKIRIVMVHRDMSLTELAEATGQTPSNLSNKLKRNNFQEKELQAIAKALDCKFESFFVMNDTGETI